MRPYLIGLLFSFDDYFEVFNWDRLRRKILMIKITLALVFLGQSMTSDREDCQDDNGSAYCSYQQ